MSDIQVKIHLEKFGEKFNRPHKSQIILWANITVNYAREHVLNSAKILGERPEIDINVRLVELDEMRHIANKHHHTGSMITVLSFPCEVSGDLNLPDLGDIVMCGESICQEASEYQVDSKLHWAHLFIHSALHLLGMEHGQEMEDAENKIMNLCSLPPPHKTSK